MIGPGSAQGSEYVRGRKGKDDATHCKPVTEEPRRPCHIKEWIVPLLSLGSTCCLAKQNVSTLWGGKRV